MPDITPVTIPVLAPTVATDVVPLVQVPPVVPSVKVMVVPAQKAAAPDIADGKALTVTVPVALQPLLSVYEMTEVPDDTPVTTPVVPATVATLVVPLVQVPPGSVFPSVSLLPTQIELLPVIAPGSVYTTRLSVAMQPAGVV